MVKWYLNAPRCDGLPKSRGDHPTTMILGSVLPIRLLLRLLLGLLSRLDPVGLLHTPSAPVLALMRVLLNVVKMKTYFKQKTINIRQNFAKSGFC